MVDIPEPISEMCTKEVLVMSTWRVTIWSMASEHWGKERLERQGLTLDDLKRDMLIKFEREGLPERTLDLRPS